MRQPFCQLQEEVMRRIAKFQKVSWEQFSGGLERRLSKYGRGEDQGNL